MLAQPRALLSSLLIDVSRSFVCFLVWGFFNNNKQSDLVMSAAVPCFSVDTFSLPAIIKEIVDVRTGHVLSPRENFNP